jgi:UTP--glucose-1-phosphate uridylyltransferase
MIKPIKKAIFPVAGLGTRFLPATKANPKEMMPIVDKPLIQYAVEEAIAIGVTQLIFVTSTSKRAIEDHFDSNYELESKLEMRGDYHLLALVRDILPRGVSCVYIRQPSPLGLGHAVLCARNVVGDEPFALLLADDLIDGNGKNCLQQLMPIYEKNGNSVVAVQHIPRSATHKYGIVAPAPNFNRFGLITGIIEKPKSEDAPSNLAAVGRYLLTPAIFDMLETVAPGTGGEIQLTDGISKLLQQELVYAAELNGKRYDCGSKLGYLEATIDYALKHPELAKEFRTYLHTLVAEEITEK